MHPMLSPDQPLPILPWIGPGLSAHAGGGGAVNTPITEKTMGDLAEAHFNVSLSTINEEDPIRDLDIARDAGIRLIIGLPGLRVNVGAVDDAWKQRIGGIIEKIRDHEGLFGYYLADEPKRPLFDDIARAFAFVREKDPRHLPYYNHWMMNMSFCGFHSYEEMWETFHEMCRPDFVSMDCYPFHVCSRDEMLENVDGEFAACYYPGIKVRHTYQYYESLELLRQFSRIFNVPVWGFTRSRPGYTLDTAEGEMRYQLMTALAYGAKGMQYFTYAHANTMVGPPPDCEPNELARIAGKLNRELRAWEPTIKKLRSIGVYHHPATHLMTRPLDQYKLGNPDDLCVREGDDVVVGQFVDDQTDWEYALICNRTPFEPAKVTFHFGTDEPVEECSALTGQWGRTGNPNRGSRKKPIEFTPGQGRLFRFKRDITPTNIAGI